jgi:hypothetical protein
MGTDKKLDGGDEELFDRYSEDINPAYERAVRKALAMHKRANNPIAVGRDGKVVILQPSEIPVE